jgi:hypothetical protein
MRRCLSAHSESPGPPGEAGGQSSICRRACRSVLAFVRRCVRVRASASLRSCARACVHMRVLLCFRACVCECLLACGGCVHTCVLERACVRACVHVCVCMRGGPEARWPGSRGGVSLTRTARLICRSLLASVRSGSGATARVRVCVCARACHESVRACLSRSRQCMPCFLVRASVGVPEAGPRCAGGAAGSALPGRQWWLRWQREAGPRRQRTAL